MLQLPPVSADLFTRAAALCATRAAQGGAAIEYIEAITGRGAAQAAHLLAAEGK